MYNISMFWNNYRALVRIVLVKRVEYCVHTLHACCAQCGNLCNVVFTLIYEISLSMWLLSLWVLRSALFTNSHSSKEKKKFLYKTQSSVLFSFFSSCRELLHTQKELRRKCEMKMPNGDFTCPIAWCTLRLGDEEKEKKKMPFSNIHSLRMNGKGMYMRCVQWITAFVFVISMMVAVWNCAKDMTIPMRSTIRLLVQSKVNAWLPSLGHTIHGYVKNRTCKGHLVCIPTW